MSFTNQTKNTSTFKNLLTHGKATILQEIADFTFTDVVFADGTQLKDVTFSELVDQVWANQTKNSVNYVNQTKN